MPSSIIIWTKRFNFMLAATVPGFCPSEAGGDEACLNVGPADMETAVAEMQISMRRN